MTNSTPSAKRTNAPVPIDISEAGTVDRAIQIEDRMAEIFKQMAYLEHLEFEASLFGDRTTWFADKLEDLESELSDLQREYRG